MDTSELLSLVDDLEENIDDLEDNLKPLLNAALSATTKNRPVLDRAKLYVLVVYSIESLLFSYLRLNGVQAKEHPVFKELTRVKQYFAKINEAEKEAETGGVKPRDNISLDKQVAGRIIKHALAGNDKYDAERRERELKEKLLARRKMQPLEATVKRKAEPEVDIADASSSEEGEINEDESGPITPSQPETEETHTGESIASSDPQIKRNNQQREKRIRNRRPKGRSSEAFTNVKEVKVQRKEWKAKKKQQKEAKKTGAGTS